MNMSYKKTQFFSLNFLVIFDDYFKRKTGRVDRKGGLFNFIKNPQTTAKNKRKCKKNQYCILRVNQVEFWVNTYPIAYITT